MRNPISCARLVLVLVLGSAAGSSFVANAAAAHSALVLAYPPAIGSIPAATYDDDGNRIGDAELTYERTESGNIHLRAVASVTGGARNLIEAEFAEIGPGSGLRVLWERSLSHDEHGKPLVTVEVDHERGEARCTPPDGSDEPAEVLKLPDDDRVANTIMSLLFLPIVEGRETALHYQAFLCRGGARFMKFVALRGKKPAGEDENDHEARAPERRDVIEVRFGPDLGRILSRVAASLVPRLRFWFDAARDGDYLAHRMPLYGGGPEVVVRRDGISADALRGD